MTGDYQAPETFKGIYSEKCDVWAMGCFMYEILAGKKSIPGYPI
jgi:serine/threonine protein kinase